MTGWPLESRHFCSSRRSPFCGPTLYRAYSKESAAIWEGGACLNSRYATGGSNQAVILTFKPGSLPKTSSSENALTLTQSRPSTRYIAERTLLFPALFGPTRAQICGNSTSSFLIDRKFSICNREILTHRPQTRSSHTTEYLRISKKRLAGVKVSALPESQLHLRVQPKDPPFVHVSAFRCPSIIRSSEHAHATRILAGARFHLKSRPAKS